MAFFYRDPSSPFFIRWIIIYPPERGEEREKERKKKRGEKKNQERKIVFNPFDVWPRLITILRYPPRRLWSPRCNVHIVIIKFNRLNYFGKKRANWIFYASSCLVISTTTVYHEILAFHGIRLPYRSRNIVAVVKFVVKIGVCSRFFLKLANFKNCWIAIVE